MIYAITKHFFVKAFTKMLSITCISLRRFSSENIPRYTSHVTLYLNNRCILFVAPEYPMLERKTLISRLFLPVFSYILSQDLSGNITKSKLFCMFFIWHCPRKIFACHKKSFLQTTENTDDYFCLWSLNISAYKFKEIAFFVQTFNKLQQEI